MKQKLINLGLVVTSLLGYLEWGGGNSAFLWQGEFELFTKLFRDPVAAAHPFTLLPLLGQILLLVTLFQREPGRVLTIIGLACLGLLLGFMFLIGVIALHLPILMSTLPFMIAAVFCILGLRKKDVSLSEDSAGSLQGIYESRRTRTGFYTH